MQKFPTTGPRRFFPSTSAVAAVSFSTTGSPSLAQIPVWMSFTYMSVEKYRDSKQEKTTTIFKEAQKHPNQGAEGQLMKISELVEGG